MMGTSKQEDDMKSIQWTSTTGENITLYVQGEDTNRNGEPCYVVSKVPNSRFVFLVSKASAR